MTPEDRLSTLGLLWAAWEQQGRGLAADQWQQPTRLGDWTVRMLYAHAASWPVGFAHLVGSSKTAYRYASRPWRYRRRGSQVFLLHLVRHPGAVMASAMKGRNSALERAASGGVPRRPFEAARTLLGWTLANLVASIYGGLFPRGYLKVVYEDLSKDPASELARIGAFTGIDPSRAIEAIQAGQAFAAGHELAGNRLLRSGSIVFRRDPESRKRWRLGSVGKHTRVAFPEVGLRSGSVVNEPMKGAI